MATVSERQRLDLYERLGETLGKEHAEVLMEYLPPVGWSDVARRADLEGVRAELRTAGAELRAEMGELRAEMGELRGEMGELRAELRGEMSELRGELRVELHQGLNRQLVWTVGTILGSVGAVLGLIAWVG